MKTVCGLLEFYVKPLLLEVVFGTIFNEEGDGSMNLL